MTSEICGMNRLAVVLAADSATTVTRWVDNKEEERYFKGANKIFQLSDHHPVGIMIFDGADLLRVPWELIVKEFRRNLVAKSFNTIEGYASEFFQYVEDSYWLFPREIRRESILDACRAAVLTMIVTHDDNESQTGDERVADRRTVVDALPIPMGMDDAWKDGIIADVRAELLESFSALTKFEEVTIPENLDLLAETAILDVIKEPSRFLGTTGIVFAGFGDHDVFPTMLEFNSEGMLADKLVVTKKASVSIDHETPAWLVAFAQTDMSDTFTLGISGEVYSSLVSSSKKAANTLVDDIVGAAGVDRTAVPGVEDFVKKAVEGIGQSVLQRAKRRHAIPLRQVLSVLPVDEMAELAETLINLQALKEKVTKPSETVGGPVDVAVITRSEGLVWIRRKQFFDSSLNSRYMQRQNAKFQ